MPIGMRAIAHAGTLRQAHVLSPTLSPPSVSPFIIPKSFAKVSILSRVGMKQPERQTTAF